VTVVPEDVLGACTVATTVIVDGVVVWLMLGADAFTAAVRATVVALMFTSTAVVTVGVFTAAVRATVVGVAA
jgi:hypothetical protein